MKKICFLFACSLLLAAHASKAQQMVTAVPDGREKLITVTSFPDYFPFAEIQNPASRDMQLVTVFDSALKLLSKQRAYAVSNTAYGDYQEAVNAVRQGQTDIILGIYTMSKLYSGLEYIYPAALNNPIHVVLRRGEGTRVKSEADLKNLKGVYVRSEYFSDYMLKNFDSYNLSSLASPDEAYEQLLTGKIDYIIGSYYFNYAYAVRHGLQAYLDFSKQALWNMPLFIGVSKAGGSYRTLVNALNRLMTDSEFTSVLSQSLKQAIQQTEAESVGVVPPKYVRSESINELTPADEQPITTTSQE
jgi:ABC-type amino acid transport substrate-binding protein